MGVVRKSGFGKTRVSFEPIRVETEFNANDRKWDADCREWQTAG